MPRAARRTPVPAKPSRSAKPDTPEPSPGSAPTRRRSAKPAVDVETKYEALVAKTIAELMTSKSDIVDKQIWRRAIREYGKLKQSQREAPTENLVRFFAVDGVAARKKHRVVFKAVRPVAARRAAWLAQLQAAE